jgi:virulence-associated protein VagC
MQKRLTNYCIFGDEKLFFTGKQELPEGTLWTWESIRKDDAGNSAMRAQILSKGDLMKRTTITEARDGKAITTAFDSSCSLIRDSKFANNVDYMLLAREHGGKFDIFMDRVRTLYQLHSSRELFRIREIRELDEAEGKKPTPQEFPNVARVVDAGRGTFVIYAPGEVMHAIGFGKGSLAELATDGKSLVLTPLKKRKYRVKTFMRNDSLQVNIPRELIQLKGIYADTLVEWSKEAPMRLSIQPISKPDKKAFVVHYVQYSNVHEVTIPKTFNLLAGLYGIWTDEGEKLVLELSESRGLMIRITSTNQGYGEHFSLHLPKELAEKTGMKNWMGVRFAINGQGQLVITPR